MSDVVARFTVNPVQTIETEFKINVANRDHNELHNRDLADQHPIEAITGLETALEGKQDALTAGENIQIEDGVISATDTTYTAGTGISIENGVISNTQTSAEWGNIGGDINDQTDLKNALDEKADVSDIPTVGNATLTIKKNGSDIGSFTANATVDEAIDISVPTAVSQLNNDSNFQTATQVANSIATETTNRENADINLQNQIDAIVSSSDVFDIVGTYAELQAYDISTVPVNDIIKVLVDSTHNNAATYYRCVESGGVKSWSYIGSEGAYYTKGEADSTFVPQTRTINGKALSSNISLTYSDVGADASGAASTAETNAKNYADGLSSNYATSAQGALADTALQPNDNISELNNDAGYITSSALSGYQTTANLVTSVSSASTNSQYPSAKLFYDTCGDIETLINAL